MTRSDIVQRIPRWLSSASPKPTCRHMLVWLTLASLFLMHMILQHSTSRQQSTHFQASANIRRDSKLHLFEPLREQPAAQRSHLSVAESAVPNNDQHVLSCYTNLSSAKDRVFSDDEKLRLKKVIEWAETVTGHCKRLVKFGGTFSLDKGLMDGDKFACMDPPFSLATSNECLVYSFGINYEWSFDEAMERFGCEVHSFDPSIDYPEGKRSKGITFHHIGIGRNEHVNVYNWSIYTLDQIIAQLNHHNRSIHYMKMDVEGGEFDMMAQQLLDRKGTFVMDRVEQIGFEVHYRLDPRLQMHFYKEALASIGKMEQLGFRLVHWEYNKLVDMRYHFPGIDHPVSLLYEILLIRSGVNKLNNRI